MNSSLPNSRITPAQAKAELKRRKSIAGVRPYLDSVQIELANKDVSPFSAKAEPFQWSLLDSLVPAIENAAGLRQDYQGPKKFFLTLPKSHAKTSLVALLASWVVCFAPQHTRLLAAAGDQKQSGFLLEAVQMVRRENPWLHPRFDIVQHKAKGKGGLLTIESSEAYTKSGVLCDIIICDELCWWPENRGKELYEVLDATTVKRPHTVLIIISNAGVRGSWQHKILQHARESDSWFVQDEPGRKASWLSEKAIADSRATMLVSHARRVLDNEWVDPHDLEDSFLFREQVLACIDSSLFRKDREI